MIKHEVTQCRKCGKNIIFLPTTKGKLAPVDAETVPITAEVFNPKAMLSHFASCPNADEFRKPKKGKKQ